MLRTTSLHQRCAIGFFGILGTCLTFTSQVRAQQIIPDGTLNTIVTQSGNSFTITNGSTAGTNLFHSFREFSIPTGGSATFDLSNTPNISTIFSRVTGSSVSNIDGVLRVLGNADLFLLNPNGVLFGKGARLDLNGSLIVSTANAISFGAQGQFSTSDATAVPLLTIRPSALWFLSNPQPITILGDSPGFTQSIVSFTPAQLQIPDRKSLVLAGGDVNLVGASIGVDQSQIAIAGLAKSGQINLLQTGNTWSLQPVSAPLANISLTQGAIVSSRRGQESRISLQGDTITLLDQSRLKVASVDNSNGGLIDIQASRLDLKNRAFIGSDAFREGTAGKIQIRATQSVNLDESLISVTTYGTSPIGGALNIDTARLAVLRGGTIGTSTFNSGNAGSIWINASESIEVSGVGSPASPSLIAPSSIESASFTLPVVRQFLNTPEEPSGSAGYVTINSNQLQVSDQGRINVRSEGIGKGGALRITANEIRLERSGLLSAATKVGEEGNIGIQSQVLLLRDQSQLSATATGTGNGGNITINSPLIIGLGNSDIVASAVQGRGGNIEITTQGILGLKYRDRLTAESDINASSDFGVNGTVQVNTIGVDPHAGLSKLSETVIDSDQQIAKGCSTSQTSSFVITGRGGVPEDPMERGSFHRTWADLRDLSSLLESHLSQASRSTLHLPSEPLREATAWHRNSQTGKVELVAAQAAQPKQTSTCATATTSHS